VAPGIPVPRPPATPAPSDPLLLVEELVLVFDVLLWLLGGPLILISG